jgi:hypothetical protein
VLLAYKSGRRHGQFFTFYHFFTSQFLGNGSLYENKK